MKVQVTIKVSSDDDQHSRTWVSDEQTIPTRDNNATNMYISTYFAIQRIAKQLLSRADRSLITLVPNLALYEQRKAQGIITGDAQHDAMRIANEDQS